MLKYGIAPQIFIKKRVDYKSSANLPLVSSTIIYEEPKKR